MVRSSPAANQVRQPKSLASQSNSPNGGPNGSTGAIVTAVGGDEDYGVRFLDAMNIV